LVALKGAIFRGKRILSSNPATVKRAHPDRRQDRAHVPARALRRKWRLGGTLIALCRDRNREHARSAFTQSSKIRASYGRGGQPVMLDKAGGDMVPLLLNLWPPKENEVAGIIIHRLS
jgi:hypothetical protein